MVNIIWVLREMTFPHSHTHSRTILGFLFGFSANNLCFLVFSGFCSRSMYYLSIAFSHSVQIHTPFWLDRLPRMTKTRFVIYYCRWSHHFMTSLSLTLLSLHVFIYSDLSHFLFFSCPRLLPACLCLFRHISPLFLAVSLSSLFSLPLYPRVRLLLPASFP